MPRVRSEQGRLDLLVHSAYNTGVIGQTMGRPSWELPPSLWDDIVLAGARARRTSQPCTQLRL